MNPFELQLNEGEGKFKLLKVADLIALPPPAWLIEDMIEENTLAVLYGPSGCGKSFTALDWALSISKGQDWQGHHTKKSRVVYVAGEGTYGIAKRVRAWMSHNKIEDINRAFFVLEAPQMLRVEQVHALIERIKKLPKAPALIVIDTLASCFLGGEENSAKDVGMFVDACRWMQKKTGAAVLLIHHTGKPSEIRPRPTERGSSALRGAADAMIRLEIKKGIIIVSNDKQKDEEQFEAVSLKLQTVDMGLDETVGRNIRSAVLVASNPGPTSEGALLNASLQIAFDALAIDLGGSAASAQWQHAISVRLGNPIAVKTFHNWKKTLLQLGKAEAIPGQKNWYRVHVSATANGGQSTAA
jgi:hypothetical protein